MHIDVAGGRVSFTPDPDPDHDIQPLAAPPPAPLYGAPALPPHVPTAMAVPTHAVMPTQIAQPLPTQLPTQVAQSLPALVRPYEDGVTPYPVPPWATGQHGAALSVQPAVAHSAVQPRYVVPQNHLDIYADTDERSAETLRVPALPTAVPSVRPPFTRYLVPIIGGTALFVFIAGYFLVRGDSSTPAHAPIAAAAAPAKPVVTAIAEPSVEPIVEPISEPQLPPPSWRERAAQPTIVATATAEPIETPVVASAEPAAEPAVEIEMTPMAAKAAPAKVAKVSRSQSRRAKRAQIAAIAAPKTTKSAKLAPETAKTKSKTEKVAKVTKTERDPILEEIEKPSRSAKAATGPGKLAISSSVPTLIYVDGRSTNLMTPKTLNLAPGTHKITLLELKTRKAKTMDVSVSSGSTARLDKQF